MTVNKRWSQLGQAASSSGRRKSGSYVRRPHVAIRRPGDRDIKSECNRWASPTAMADRAGKAQKHRPGRRRLDLRRRRRARVSCRHSPADPFCFEQRLINLAAVPERAKHSRRSRPAMAAGSCAVERRRTRFVPSRPIGDGEALRVPLGTPA